MPHHVGLGPGMRLTRRGKIIKRKSEVPPGVKRDKDTGRFQPGGKPYPRHHYSKELRKSMQRYALAHRKIDPETGMYFWGTKKDVYNNIADKTRGGVTADGIGVNERGKLVFISRSEKSYDNYHANNKGVKTVLDTTRQAQQVDKYMKSKAQGGYGNKRLPKSDSQEWKKIAANIDTSNWEKQPKWKHEKSMRSQNMESQMTAMFPQASVTAPPKKKTPRRKGKSKRLTHKKGSSKKR